MPITTLETDLNARLIFPTGSIDPFRWARFLTARQGRHHPLRPEIGAEITPAAINHGRWVADCPQCRAALIVSKQDRRFWCPLCGLPWNGFRGIAVQFPNAAAIKTIETILLMRPDPHNRNWRPGESIAQLARENLDHGCTVILER
jgi:hypothetical protein